MLGRTAAEHQRWRDGSVHLPRRSVGALHAFFRDGELCPGNGGLAALPAKPERIVYVPGRQHREARVSLYDTWVWDGERKLVEASRHAAGRLVTHQCRQPEREPGASVGDLQQRNEYRLMAAA